jgi:hypothetical protein
MKGAFHSLAFRLLPHGDRGAGLRGAMRFNASIVLSRMCASGLRRRSSSFGIALASLIRLAPWQYESAVPYPGRAEPLGDLAAPPHHQSASAPWRRHRVRLAPGRTEHQ